MEGARSIWDGLVADVEEFLGGVQGSISLGDGGLSGELHLGERRVFSWGAIAAALVIGWLLGRAG